MFGLFLTSVGVEAKPLGTTVISQGQADTTLTATVSTTAHYTRTFGWTIDKSVTPSTWNLFTGDHATSTYMVAVTKDSGHDAAWFDDPVCVKNGGAVATENLAIVANLASGEQRNGKTR